MSILETENALLVHERVEGIGRMFRSRNKNGKIIVRKKKGTDDCVGIN